MLQLQRGLRVRGMIIDRFAAVMEGEIISILERTVIVSTTDHRNVVMRKCDLTILEG